MTQTKNEVVVQKKKDVITTVEKKINELQQSGDLHFPENYSPQNALKSAWLTIQSTVDKNKKPALDVCTQNSVANALLNTVILGLNPAKSQVCYIVRGNKLYASPEYFGTIAATKRVKGVISVFAQVVYKDDELEYTIDNGVKNITLHKQKLANIDNAKIIAAYAVINYEEKGERKDYAEVMTYDEIKQAWKQSPMNPIDDKGNVKSSSTHGKFTQEMAKKTVLNRTCKMFFKTSSDSDLIIETLNKITGYVEEDIEEEIKDNANKEIIDVSDFEEVTDQVEEVVEPEEEGNYDDNVTTESAQAIAQAMTKAQEDGQTPF